MISKDELRKKMYDDMVFATADFDYNKVKLVCDAYKCYACYKMDVSGIKQFVCDRLCNISTIDGCIDSIYAELLRIEETNPDGDEFYYSCELASTGGFSLRFNYDEGVIEMKLQFIID